MQVCITLPARGGEWGVEEPSSPPTEDVLRLMVEALTSAVHTTLKEPNRKKCTDAFKNTPVARMLCCASTRAYWLQHTTAPQVAVMQTSVPLKFVTDHLPATLPKGVESPKVHKFLELAIRPVAAACMKSPTFTGVLDFFGTDARVQAEDDMCGLLTTYKDGCKERLCQALRHVADAGRCAWIRMVDVAGILLLGLYDNQQQLTPRVRALLSNLSH